MLSTWLLVDAVEKGGPGSGPHEGDGGNWITVNGQHILIDAKGNYIINGKKLDGYVNIKGHHFLADKKTVSLWSDGKKIISGKGEVKGKPGDKKEVAASRALHEKIASAQIGEFSKDEAHAVNVYSGGAYRNMNKALRNGSDAGNYRKNIENLQNAIRRFPLPQDVTVYRGGKGIRIVGNSVGSVFQDKGFVSTSLSKSGAYAFAASGFATKNGVVYKISASKGDHALALNNVESEILFGAGSKFKISSISTDSSLGSHPVKVISMKYIGASGSSGKAFKRFIGKALLNIEQTNCG